MAGKSAKSAQAGKNGPLADDLFLVQGGDGDRAPARTTLSFSRTPTVLLTFAANRFTRSASRIYQQDFGIGAMDWRMLVMLAREPGSSVSHASRTIGIDKAAVSRCLARLEEKDLVEAQVDRAGGDTRRREWQLTQKGAALHDRILVVALERQQRLLDGFSPDDVERFNDYLSRFLDNLESLSSAHPGRS